MDGDPDQRRIVKKWPKITFGIIVLNGEPFTRYCLRSLYPFAHKIIVVEGACKSAACNATPNGHSRDGTLDVLRRFKAEEDPQNKIQIITKEGFWTEKDEMSRAYTRQAQGEYIWQVDIDEFYRAEDMEKILTVLRDDPRITAISFPQISFWGGFDFYTDGFFLKEVEHWSHRIFRWGAGYRYCSHRPPIVADTQARDLRKVRPLNARDMKRMGVYRYHYCLLFPHQVLEKCRYYDAAQWTVRAQMEQWAQQTFLQMKHPLHVHNVYTYLSWLERFRGAHPEQAQCLRQDILNGTVHTPQRETEDIEQLLRSPLYSTEVFLLKILLRFYPTWLATYKVEMDITRQLRQQFK
ncbi:glycosyltransferase family 2 protein [Candidatus Peregrinibacteria bacterium CG10_big_fil_rev_8_21_14_0_10_55_24]|nr:MAG: glycosyltransferase family 2 protein [Candidatus Peregrinibacteria bacterium CG10_big_fil_rev_8_21_14_0_10_55_24]